MQEDKNDFAIANQKLARFNIFGCVGYNLVGISIPEGESRQRDKLHDGQVNLCIQVSYLDLSHWIYVFVIIKMFCTLSYNKVNKFISITMFQILNIFFLKKTMSKHKDTSKQVHRHLMLFSELE